MCKGSTKEDVEIIDISCTKIRDNPKSVNFKCPSCPMSMLSGLMSLEEKREGVGGIDAVKHIPMHYAIFMQIFQCLAHFGNVKRSHLL